MVIRTVLPCSDEAVIESYCVPLRGSSLFLYLLRLICNEIQYDEHGILAYNSNGREKYSQTHRFKNNGICYVSLSEYCPFESIYGISLLMRLCLAFISRYAKLRC